MNLIQSRSERKGGLVTLIYDEKRKKICHNPEDEEFVLGMLRNIEPILAEDWNRPEDEWWIL